MFLEPRHKPGSDASGWIELICGGMFSGKTEELIRRLKRAMIAGQKVEIFKPHIDVRYSASKVVSHDENEIHSERVQLSSDVLTKSGQSEVIGIDEAQFFDDLLVNVANQLANDGKRVIIAGLDMDSTGQPFGPVDQLMACAEHVTKLHAVCMDCGNMASYSYRLKQSEEKIVIGEKDVYQALCRSCFNEKMRRS